MLTTDSLINLEYVDPSTTPDGIFFPAATVTALDPGGRHIYSKFDATEGNLVGITQIGSQPIVYSEPMLRAVFPCTYLTTWTDSLHAAYVISGYTYQREGHITATADGYGTLIMPYGQVENVLRVTYVEDFRDHSLLTGNFDRAYTCFFQAGTHHPIVTLFSYSLTVLNNPQTTTGAQWLEVSTTSIEQNANMANGLSVSPVPATDAITVRFDGGSSACSIDVIDALGQVTMHRDVRAITTGMYEERIVLTGLGAAVYTVRVTQGGRVRSQRIVVQ